MLITCGVLACGAYFVHLDAKIRWYDKRFPMIQFGQTEGEMVKVLGIPTESVEAPPYSRKYGISRFSVYRVKRIGPPVRWSIGLNGEGKVVSKHRDDNGC